MKRSKGKIFSAKTIGVVKSTYLAIVLVLLFAIILMSAVFYSNNLKIKKAELRDQLLHTATELNFNLQDSLLNKELDISDSDIEKVLALNEILQPVVDKLSSAHPSFGIGYYDIRLDSIIAFVPDFQPTKLDRLPHDASYFKSYQSGNVEFIDSNTSVSWNGSAIIAVTLPVFSDAKIIGHIWVNQKTQDLYIAAFKASSKLLTGSLLLILIMALIIWIIIKRIDNALKHTVQSFLDGRFSIESGLSFQEMRPLLEKAKEYSDKLLRYESIVRDATDAIICINMDGCVTYINEAASKMFGYSPIEIIGQKVFVLCQLGTEQELQKTIDKIRAGEETSSYEATRCKKDGQTIEISVKLSSIKDSDGNIVGISKITRDLTEHHKNQKELISSTERFSKVFQNSPTVMSIIRKSDRRYIDVNQLFVSECGLTREEVIGQIAYSTDLPGLNDLLNMVDSKKSIRNIELDRFDKNGQSIGTLLMSAETFELEGEVCLLIAGTDITELKLLQAELARLDRLNLVGQMAAGIGHEIRNPLTTIRGFLQLMGVKIEFLSSKSTIDLMISEIDRANVIITAFLSLAKVQKPDLRFENLNSIIANLFPLIQADAFTQNKDSRIILGDIPDFLPLDAKEITQLILNICRNGLDAMNEGGCLTIQTHSTNDEVILTIEDEGCGIPTEYLEKLGIPFFTTKDQGTGLGLAICYRIAQSNNAEIDVSSSPKGTVFIIRFAILSGLTHVLDTVS